MSITAPNAARPSPVRITRGISTDRLRARLTLEPAWELADDPDAQHVGHVQDVAVDAVVRNNVRGPVTIQTSDGFIEGPLEMCVHHRAHLGLRPVGVVGAR